MNYNKKHDTETAMIVCVVAKCNNCGEKTKLYVPETTSEEITHECPSCKHDKFTVTFRC